MAPHPLSRPSGKSRLVMALLAILCLCAVFIVWHEIQNHHFLLEPDSAAYLSAADRLWHEHRYARYDDDPAPDWPPLTSVALIVPLAITRTPIAAFALMNTFCFVTLLLLSWAWLSRHVRSRPVMWCALALLLTALPMRRVIAAGYSEPLFSVLALASLILLNASVTTRRRLFVMGCLLAASACLTRYLGITVVVTGILLLLRQSEFALRVRLIRALAFAVTSLLPLALWCLRNHFMTGTFMGDRDPAHVTFAQNLRVMGGVLGAWFSSGPFLAAAIGGACLVIALCRGPWRRPLLLPLAFAVIYAGGLLESASHVDMDQIDFRLLFPIFVPLVWALAQCVDAARNCAKGAVWRRIPCAVWGLFCLVVGGYGVTTRWNTDDYNGQAWRAVPWSHLRAALPSDARLYSNDAPACYLFLHRTVEWLPDEGEEETTPALRQALRAAAVPGYYLWFDSTLVPSSEDLDAANKKTRFPTIWRGPHLVLLAIGKK